MATYMAGSFREHITEEEIREAAYRKGREDQGKLNAETVKEIRELVYQQGIEKGRADKYQEIVSEYMLLTEKQVADIRADVIEEYKQRLLEDLNPLKDKYFDIAKGTSMPERYTHLKRMDTVELIIEMVELKAEQLKEKK